MKKILLSLGAISFMLASSYAQDANVGLKIGMMQTEWYGSDVTSITDDETFGSSGDNQKFYMGKMSNLIDFEDDLYKGDLEIGDEYSYITINAMPTKRWGFHAGFQINSEINDYFWLKHEFLFSTKGFAFSGTQYSLELESLDTSGAVGFATDEQDIELVYRTYNVDIMPVSLAGHYEGLQLFVGPMVSVMLGSAWVDKTNGIVTTPGNNDFLYKADPEDIIGHKDNPTANVTYNEAQRTPGIIDYGFVAGFEYELPFGLHAGVRYVQGFASVMEPVEGQPRINAFNKDLRFSLGYTFGKE